MIGPIVRRLRTERGLSQETLADTAHVSSGYLSKLERGVYRQPSYEVLSRIATALSVPVADMLRDAGMEHLLLQADPSLEPVLESFAAKLNDLPKRDRDLIMIELQRIVREESEDAS